MSLLHISGSVEVNQSIDEDLRFKTEIESEITFILESHPSVKNAEVSVTRVEKSNSLRQKRSSEKFKVDFVSICSILLFNVINIDVIKSSLIDSIVTSESFISSQNSFVIETPKIINIVKRPIDDKKIGL